MKIVLRGFWQEDATHIIDRHSELNKSINPTAPMHDFESTDELLRAFVQLTKLTRGTRFNPIVSFSDEELDDAEFFHVVFRGKLLRENRKDKRWNYDCMNNARLIKTGESSMICLMRGLALSKIRLDSDRVGGIEWQEELVIGQTTSAVFKGLGVGTCQCVPVWNPMSMEFHSDYWQLFTESVMPLAELDITTTVNRNAHAEGSSYRARACLTYTAGNLRKACDFNRTAEPWGPNFFPKWIVSRKVRAATKQYGIRGLEFVPVLVEGSQAQSMYLRQWRHIFDILSLNPFNYVM